jgi:hypothetical protein
LIHNIETQSCLQGGFYMEQTRVKLSVTALAILAFVLSYFGQLELLFLLIAYAVIIDKSQPLTRMSLQALYLYLAYRLIRLVIGWIFGFFSWFFNLVNAYGAVSGFATVEGYINIIISLAFFVACVLAVIQIISKQKCELPMLNTMADKTLGLVVPKAKPQPQYQQPVQPYQAPTAPPPPAAPVVPPPVQPAPPPAAAPTAPAAAPAAPTAWTCSCGHQNHGNFCMKCGSPRPK